MRWAWRGVKVRSDERTGSARRGTIDCIEVQRRETREGESTSQSVTKFDSMLREQRSGTGHVTRASDAERSDKSREERSRGQVQSIHFNIAIS